MMGHLTPRAVPPAPAGLQGGPIYLDYNAATPIDPRVIEGPVITNEPRRSRSALAEHLPADIEGAKRASPDAILVLTGARACVPLTWWAQLGSNQSPLACKT